MRIFLDIISNPFVLIAIGSWLEAQVLKTIIHAIVNRKLDIERLFGDGGMPSGHSATVSSLAAAVGLVEGFSTAAFAIAAVLAVVVCHDAMGVRQETGKQAKILNALSENLESVISGKMPEIKLKEFVGHTPSQVTAGILLGITNAIIMYYTLFR